MNEHKYYLTVNNRTVAEGVTCEYALIFTKAIIEHFYNDQVIKNWDDYNSVAVEDFVTHWIPMPQPPKGGMQ